MHTQCLLRKANTEQVAWIPSAFAKVGKHVKLRPRGEEEWDDGWLVAAAWTVQASEETNDRSQDHKHQHEASDAYRDKEGRWVTPGSR